MAISVDLDVVFIHDTIKAGQIYSATHLELQKVQPISGVETPQTPMPMGLIPSARCALFGDGCALLLEAQEAYINNRLFSLYPFGLPG